MYLTWIFGPQIGTGVALSNVPVLVSWFVVWFQLFFQQFMHHWCFYNMLNSRRLKGVFCLTSFCFICFYSAHPIWHALAVPSICRFTNVSVGVDKDLFEAISFGSFSMKGCNSVHASPFWTINVCKWPRPIMMISSSSTRLKIGVFIASLAPLYITWSASTSVSPTI